MVKGAGGEESNFLERSRIPNPFFFPIFFTFLKEKKNGKNERKILKQRENNKKLNLKERE